MRLDITLVDRLGRELALDDHVCLCKSGFQIAETELDALGDIGRFLRCGLDSDREHVVVQQRRIGLHRRLDVDHVRQHFIVDIDQ